MPVRLISTIVLCSLALACASAGELTRTGMQKRTLIVTADDLGAAPCIDAGIVEAYRAGILTGTTALINYPRAPEAVKAVHEGNPDLPIGLHLNITSGPPVSDPERIPTLVDEDGNFYPIDRTLRHMDEFSLVEVEIELRAQIARFLATGVTIDHLDYHFNILSIYSPFYDLVIRIAKEQDLPVRNPIPISLQKVIKSERTPAKKKGFRMFLKFIVRHPIKAAALSRYIRPAEFDRNYNKVIDNSLACPDYCIDLFYGNPTTENLIHILENLPPGVSELVVHAGKACRPEDAPAGIDAGYFEYRVRELETIKDPAIRQKLAELGIELAGYNTLTSDAGIHDVCLQAEPGGLP